MKFKYDDVLEMITDTTDTYCPLVSSFGVYWNPDDSEEVGVIGFVPCIRNRCEFWDTSSCVIVTIKDIPSIIREGEIIRRDYDEHIHDSHYHIKPHDANNLDAGLGGSLKKATAEAVGIVAEYSAGEDMDGNTYVYGKHFWIDPNDANVPLMVKQIEVPIGTTIDIISWADYWDSTSIYSIHVKD
jgi:hypothetical protein